MHGIKWKKNGCQNQTHERQREISIAPCFVDRVGKKKASSLLNLTISAFFEFIWSLREIGRGEERVTVAHSKKEWAWSLKADKE